MKYLFLMILIFPKLALACSLPSPTNGAPYEEQVNNYIASADYVFLGSVDEYEWKPNPQWNHDKAWHYHKITPIEQFKGDIQGSIEYWPGTSCNEVFNNIGEKFIFFGFEYDGIIQFSITSGSIPMNHANKMGLIEKLRKLNKNSSNKNM